MLHCFLVYIIRLQSQTMEDDCKLNVREDEKTAEHRVRNHDCKRVNPNACRVYTNVRRVCSRKKLKVYRKTGKHEGK